jgi:hypothetical protein
VIFHGGLLQDYDANETLLKRVNTTWQAISVLRAIYIHVTAGSAGPSARSIWATLIAVLADLVCYVFVGFLLGCFYF